MHKSLRECPFMSVFKEIEVMSPNEASAEYVEDCSVRAGIELGASDRSRLIHLDNTLELENRGEGLLFQLHTSGFRSFSRCSDCLWL